MLGRVMKPLIQCIWYETLTRVIGMLSGSTLLESPTTSSSNPPVSRLPPEDAPTANPSPCDRLPQEIVDMIITYLIHNTRSLRACSSISRSWRIAAVPIIYRTLTIHTHNRVSKKKTEWPVPLRTVSEFGFLPLVKRVSLSGFYRHGHRFSATEFDYRIQYEFSALKNVQELSIDYLDIPSFIPRIQQYFGQFSPTLRSLTLTNAQGTGQQVVFFIGLFPHLEDLNLRDCWASGGQDQEDDPTLVPPFVPPLRGRLTIESLDCIAKGMTDMFGELQFRHMDLDGCGVEHLLFACPNTLETLDLNAMGICGLWDIDLSRNKSLRELRITANDLISCLRRSRPATTPNAFKTMLSTIKSPAFSDVIVVYRQGDFYNYPYSGPTRYESEDEEAWYHRQFEVFHAMYEVRDYRLVLSVDCASDDPVRELERAVATERAKGGLPPQIEIPCTAR